ncbi:hypothetical protein Aduo_005549 [Ancylostoma duodenale]
MIVTENQAKAVCHLLREPKRSKGVDDQFGKELFRALLFKGVESMDDLNDFLTTTESDGDLLSEICGKFNTDVLQVRDVLGEIQQFQNARQSRSQSTEDIGWMFPKKMVKTDRPATRLTGAVYAQHSRHHSEPWNKAGTEDRGQAYKLLAYMQDNTCVNPGVFEGVEHENCEELIGRFGRKHKGVIMDDHTLNEILGDDHLKGKAKNVFLSIPEEVREPRIHSSPSPTPSELSEPTTTFILQNIHSFFSSAAS